MPTVVGVIFKRNSKVYYFDPDGLELQINEPVIVQTSRGTECATVVTEQINLEKDELPSPLKKVLRKLTEHDGAKCIANEAKEKKAFAECTRLIESHGMPMKLRDVEMLFDGSKLIFYFTADGRVDFRELVKELAAKFKTRIEMKQIGVRDEAKLIGGLGPCGRALCCSLFLCDFDPVSIKMAKEQDLPLNPIKISGICGRLMCCLKYEFDTYSEFKQAAPNLGVEINTDRGKGIIVGYNVPREMVVIELETQVRFEMPICEVHKKLGKNTSG